MTPEPILWRRIAFAALALAILAGLVALAARVLGAGGWTVWEWVILLAFLGTAPWLALSAANGIVGFAILMTARDPVAAVLPVLSAVRPGAPRAVTAIIICVRNEAMAAVLPPLATLLDALEAKGVADRFRMHILSDTQDAAKADAESRAVASFIAGRSAGVPVHYRRRARNTGYKSGNVMEFCNNHAGDAAFFLCLDADSTMSADAVLRLVACMEADDRLAIVQQMIVGRPARAAFPRLFQFGMRAGMRAWGTGQAWWQGDEGPYWGHNAIIRIAPFRAHCRLDPLPDGSHILSHDQVEATRLHAAGWKVRVLTAEDGSAEGNPPAMPEFITRDLRWAAGNMQYWQLLRLPGLTPMARWQLVQAILLFLGAPLWALIFAAAVANAATGGGATTPMGLLALWMLAAWACHYAPKLLGYAEVLCKPALGARYGGRAAFARGVAAELAFTLFFEPARTLHQALFLAALACGRKMGWAPQNRDDRGVAWWDAARMFWVETAIGIAASALLSGTALLFALPVLASLLLVIPFAVLTADPMLSTWVRARGIAAVPEELAPAA
ncbi:glucans biosynthesis glucosyltransferase MdoH [Plastoroseomonas arctica]|uniref:Glucans biosynthesis glucosyltransferase H n=1 Tax=Plastoroseomonas arctica TaxID=1509237 RepID=A0AAF1K5R3_9PROT|nr:glucans biosynthesis glucosyltransferase MdoH [Plastoroseomonas arctica]MBR0657078.1 glucans biosynthesis glucosyltransferase MdoH [Plastoroseomonas arctica]